MTNVCWNFLISLSPKAKTAVQIFTLFSFLTLAGCSSGEEGSASPAPAAPSAPHSAATNLVITTEPTVEKVHAAWNNQIIAEIRDVNSNIVSTGADATAAVTLSVKTGTGALIGTTTVNAVAGVVTFSGVEFDTIGDKVFTLSKADTSGSGGTGTLTVDTDTVSFTPNEPTQITFATQPGGGAAGNNWAQQPVLELKDAWGNLCTNITAQVNLTLSTGTGTLGGTTSVYTSGGIATFTNLNINLMGNDKVLSASVTGAAGVTATSNSFTITANAPAKIFFNTQPGGGVAGQVWAQQPVVRVEDNYGNMTSYSGNIDMTLTTGTGVLSTTTTVAAVNGVATFTDLSIQLSGTDKVITASGTGLTSANSNAFTITHSTAAGIAFAQQPGDATAGQTLPQQPIVAIVDTYGNVVTSATNEVTLTLTSGTGPLNGTLAVNAVNGLASFTNLSLNKSGGKGLTASSTGYSNIASSLFTINPAAASKLAFTTQPGGGAAAQAWAQQPVVEVRDTYDNLVTSSSASVTLTLSQGTGTLGGTATINASSGVASFAGLAINLSGTNKILTASSTGLSSAASNQFTITAGDPALLAYTTQPGGGTAGVSWAQQPVVEIRDAQGNVVSTSSLQVTLTLSQGTGTLGGTVSLNAVNGIATFTDVSLDKVGTNKILSATATGLVAADSNVFTIVHNTPTTLAFTTQPGGGEEMQVWAQQPVVSIQDSYGNNITSGTDATATITLSVNSGTGSLSGTVNATAVNGVATFTDLSMSVFGSKTLLASKPDLTGSGGVGPITQASSSFTITPCAHHLTMTTQPSGGIAGQVWGTQPVVEVRNAAESLCTNSSHAITMSLTTGTGALGGTTSVNAVAGIATFTNLTLNLVGTNKVITASGASMTSAASSAFSITHASAAQLAFTTQPGGGLEGQTWAQQPTVQIQDAYGNPVISGIDSTANITLSVASGTGVLSGTNTVMATLGSATFAGLSMNLAGTKTLNATKQDLSGSGGTGSIIQTSDSFVISVCPSQLAFTTQPGGGVAGSVWAQQPVIEVRDTNGNLCPASTLSVTVSKSSGTGALSGTKTLNAINGVVTFTNLSIELIGSKNLTASGSGVTSAISSAFNITPDAVVASSNVAANPTTIFADGSSTSTITVTLVDQFGNPVSGKTVTLSSNLGTVTGSPATSNASGVASFTLSSATAGTATLSAVGDGVSLSTQPTVILESYVSSITYSRWRGIPITTEADGSSQLSLTFTVRNANNVPLPNKTVTLASSRGASDTITGSPGTTDANGEVTFTVTSLTLGEATLTATVTADSVNIVGSGLFLDVKPLADYQPRFSYITSIENLPGSNSAPTSLLGNLDNYGVYDGTLNNFAYNTTTSGWWGDGTTTISSNATGPYRLGFSGANSTFVNMGSNLSSLNSMSVIAWVRPANLTDKGKTIFGHGDTNYNGMSLKQSNNGLGNLELTLGNNASYLAAVMADSPTGYWRLGESAGTTAAALAGLSGTYNGTVSYSQTTSINDNNTSIGFNGTDTYIDMGASYNYSTDISVEAWIRPSSIGTTQVILSKPHASGSKGYGLVLESTGKVSFRAYGESAVTGATTLVAGNWYHVVGLRNNTSGNLELYINGASDATPVASALTTGGANFNIGRLSTGGSYFSGLIDDVAVYSTALTSTRIAAHYSARTVQACHSSTAMTTSTWSHVAASFDFATTTMKLYVNGSLECTRSSTSRSMTTNYQFSLGAAVDGTGAAVANSYWSGALGDVQIWNVALSATQISNQKTATQARFP